MTAGAKSRVSEWSQPRSWLLPRDLEVEVPRGYRWCGVAKQHALAHGCPRAVVTPEDWGPEVAPQVRLLVIAPAVQCHYTREGASYPEGGRVRARRHQFVLFRPGDRVTVQASSSRSGELWVAPLTDIEGPPQPQSTTGVSQ